MMSLKNMVRGLEDHSVAKQLIQHWEHDPDTLKFWRASSNFIYLFEKNGVRQFLRFIHEEDNTFDNIQAELDFMQHLRAGNCPTVSPVLSNNQRSIESISIAGHGRYYGVVFEEATGVPLALDSITQQQAEEWGQSLASMHLLSETYASGAAKRASWLDALNIVSAVLQRYPCEIAARQELERVLELLSKLPTGTKHIGLIHYDFQLDNVFYDEREARFCIIDFDDAMIHWYAMDIAAAISELVEQQNAQADSNIEHFLTGYRSIRYLDESWVQLLPLFQRFSNLYTFARLLRSVEAMDDRHSPEWAVGLKDKLSEICARIRKNFRPAIKLQPIDHSNWYACTQLEVTSEQDQVYPVPAVYWLAESAYCGYNPLAMYVDEQMVGYAVYAVDPDDGSYWIMAFMIDHKFQYKGLGRSGMEELIHYIQQKHKPDKIVLGHRLENERAGGLYASLGFIETGRNEREVIRELKLSK